MLNAPAASFQGAIPFPVSVETKSFADTLALGEDLAEVDLLIVPLSGPDFDALDVIERLGTTVFMGRIRVVSAPLTNRAKVLAELRAKAAPLGLQVELSDCLGRPHSPVASAP